MVTPRDIQFLQDLPGRMKNPQIPPNDGLVKIPPELAQRLVEEEIKRRMDPNYKLTSAATEKIAADMSKEALNIQREVIAERGGQGRGERTSPDSEDIAERAALMVQAGVEPMEAVRMAKEGKGVVVLKSKEDRQKRRYTVMPDGLVTPDPDGDFETMNDAIMASYNMKQRAGPAFYYQDPESGDIKEAHGPVMIPQKSPPEVLMMDEQGEIKQLDTSKPMVFHHKADPQSGVRTVVMQPDGSSETYEPGQVVIIKQPAPAQSPIPLIPTTFSGPDGQTSVVNLPFPQLSEYIKTTREMQRDDDKHKAWMDLMGTLKEQTTLVSRAADRTSKRGPRTGQEGSAPQITQPEVMQKRECPDCGLIFGVPEGTPDVLCPNPQCPANQPSGQQAQPPGQQPEAQDEEGGEQ